MKRQVSLVVKRQVSQEGILLLETTRVVSQKKTHVHYQEYLSKYDLWKYFIIVILSWLICFKVLLKSLNIKRVVRFNFFFFFSPKLSPSIGI